MWKDGQVEKGIRSNDLIPIQHLDGHEFCPGDFVVDTRSQASQDPGKYGVIQSGDHKGRTCVVKWIKLNMTGDDVEVLGLEEDVSVYDIADHPDFHFRITDIVIRIWDAENDCENESHDYCDQNNRNLRHYHDNYYLVNIPTAWGRAVAPTLQQSTYTSASPSQSTHQMKATALVLTNMQTIFTCNHHSADRKAVFTEKPKMHLEFTYL
uniref:UBE2O-like SH3-B domain-containing protein n=1 Tax=Periophthalmus magnuspinnatus TaxID=409849 RepID=A0A3B3ZAK1_9GOBI